MTCFEPSQTFNCLHSLPCRQPSKPPPQLAARSGRPSPLCFDILPSLLSRSLLEILFEKLWRCLLDDSLRFPRGLRPANPLYEDLALFLWAALDALDALEGKDGE